MEVKLLYSTPNYHKLVETVARVCYQSYHKDDVNSHNFIKAIMANGHISVASVGNMVFEFDGSDFSVLADLVTMHEITPFVKWSLKDMVKNPHGKNYVSMNMLTLLDIYKERKNYEWSSELPYKIFCEVDKIPCLRWFIYKDTELPEIKNEYTAKGIPSLYEPIILDEDYTALKALGLTDYELGIHATITANFITDRSASLQFWRHWSGGCELSQRYVERGNAKYREMIDAEDDILKTIEYWNKENIQNYELLLDVCAARGIRKGRAKEIARSILPNSITTQLIQSRPYRNWMHLFKLRDSNHAQREIQEDVIHLKRVLNEMDVPTE